MSQVYTRGEIAAALGISRMHGYRLLPGNTADGFTLRGCGASAWSLDALPASIRERLADRARQIGCAVDYLLARPTPRRFTGSALLCVRLQHFNSALALRHFFKPFLSRFSQPGSASWWTPKLIAREASYKLPDLNETLGSRHLRTLVRAVVRHDQEAN